MFVLQPMKTILKPRRALLRTLPAGKHRRSRLADVLGCMIEIDHLAVGEWREKRPIVGCPVAQTFPATVEREIMKVPGVTAAHVEIVWDPPWTPERMSEAAKLALGML